MPSEKLIEAALEHNPDVIGMSGLLVKSAQQMVSTVKDFKAAAINTPVLVGGAALTQKFTTNKIQPEYDGIVVYAKDAMHGLDLVNQLVDKERADGFIKNYRETFKPGADDKAAKKKASQPLKIKPKNISYDYSIPEITAKHYGPVLKQQNLETLWPYINRQMLYGHHLGLKGNVKKQLENEEKKAMKLYRQVIEVRDAIIEKDLLKAKGMYQFFKAKVDGNVLVILSEDEQTELQRFDFPRQPAGYQFCLTDFVHPEKVDTICFFVVTSGYEILNYAKSLKKKKNF